MHGPCHIMKRMGYDLSRGEGLNFEKGWCIPLQPLPKGSVNYYDQTHRGLGYVTPSITSYREEESDCSAPSHSSDSSNWESNVSMGAIFKNLSINLTSIYQKEEYQGAEVKPFDSDPWTQQLNYQWDMRFELLEPPTEDEVVQMM